MRNDPIVAAIHKARQRYAAKFDYDLDKIYADLKQKEKASGKQVISPPVKKTRKPRSVA